MAVVTMRRFRILALKKNRKKLLESLQRAGLCEITPRESEESGFARQDTREAVSAFEKSSRQAEEALAVLNRVSPKKSGLLAGFAPLPALPDEIYYAFYEKSAGVNETAKKILALDREILEGRASLAALAAREAAIRPWEALDLPLTGKTFGNPATLIGTLPGRFSEESLLAALWEKDEALRAVHLEKIGELSGAAAFFFLCRPGLAPRLESALRELGFAYPAVQSSLPPAEELEALAKQKEETQKSIEQAEASIAARESAREDLAVAADYYRMRAEKYQVIAGLLQSSHTVCIEGFVPAPALPRLEAICDRCGAYLEQGEPEADEPVPVLLKNNGFASPVEPVLESYSMPARGELDPTAIMSVFYYILFGIMFSDAGYGLLLALGTGLLLLKYRQTPKKKMLKMFFFCGVSTFIWGILLGSFFGDAFEVIGRTFFAAEWHTPHLLTGIDLVKAPMQALVYTMLIGLIHLFAGLCCAIANAVKRKDWLSALADSFSWILLIGGLAVLLAGSEIFASIAQMTIVVPPWLHTAALVMAALGALLVLLFAGRESRNPLIRFAKGLYGLYGVTSYLGDVLSYSRLLALGLATGVIGQVINQMAASAGSGAVGAVIFAVIFLVGHLLNFAINVLGAYVHTNRLQYVEFFGKFYEGGGRKFSPFAIKNKHVTFKEEEV